MMNKFNKLLIAVGLFALATNAIAVPISGSIGFAGSYTHDGTIDLSDAKTITPTTALVFGATGDFGAITTGTAAAHSPFTFAPIPVVPVLGLWSVGGFTFDLTTMVLQSQSASIVDLTGAGVMKNAGFDDTDFTWVFTANQSGATLTFSSSDANVPAPGIALLMAIGLAGIGVASKARKSV